MSKKEDQVIKCPISFDPARLREIVEDCTHMVQKGRVLAKSDDADGIAEQINALPDANDFPVEDFDLVDCHFIMIAVDWAKAEDHRSESENIIEGNHEHIDQGIMEFLQRSPGFSVLGEMFSDPETGDHDQGMAMRFMAMGQTLDWWSVLIPAHLGLTGREADTVAAGGGVVTTGYKVDHDAQAPTEKQIKEMHDRQQRIIVATMMPNGKLPA